VPVPGPVATVLVSSTLYDRQSINNQRTEGLLSSYDRPPDLDQ
jgi:hypothetical protein